MATTSWTPDFAQENRHTPIPLDPISMARPLGVLEQFFWLIDQHRSVHFSMAAHIEGPTEIPAWREALNALQQRHPLLSVGIVGNGNAPYFRTVTNAPIPLRVEENSNHSSWQLEVAKELATPFQPEQAPLIRAVLLHGMEKSFLILTAHHSIADGFSLTYAVRDVMRSLSGEVLEPLSLMPQQELLIQTLPQSPVITENSVQPVPPSGRHVSYRAADDSLPIIQGLQLSPEVTRKVIESCRREETTVHGALCAAVALAGREGASSWSKGPVRILSPFNLRKQIGIKEDCGVFVWAANTPIDAQTPTDFWKIARAAKSSLTAAQAPDVVASGMAGLSNALGEKIDVLTASHINAQAFPCELLLTNLGNLSCNFNYGELKLKALWGPAVFMGFDGEQTVGVTTTNGSLCLLHSSFQPLPSLLQRTEHILGSVL